MIALREDQVKQKIDNVQNIVGNDLTQYKSQYLPPVTDPLDIFPNRNYHDILRPNTVGSRLTAAEINAKIKDAFKKVGLHDMQFEYALIVGSLRNAFGYIEKQSANFDAAYANTVSNYATSGIGIVSPSGSAGENLSNDELLIIVALNWKQVVVRSLTWNFLMSLLFTCVILAAFYVTVYTMLRQKKLSDIKNDFINNMTHEFKTPIATISLAVDALKNQKVLASSEKISYFNDIIKEENQRMNRQVETILKSSQFEKQEVDVELHPVHVHEIIHNIIDNFALQLHDKNGEAELLFEAPNDVIKADEMHFGNLINNLVDNAIKYSKENVPIHLKIITQNNNNKLVIRFEDNGIGMSKETQKRVFEKFYRAHTGNLHNVKGFGLGLNYVKSVTLSHHGNVRVESVLGKGSCFILEFPLTNDN